ncbi:GMC family oxidoreductase [Anaeromyxobacter paludicola]|uniref:GMC family oxidoreductase n=1 Tax=Anaeromyxobacter paludicola TaxID=2918171 RepID=A0ABN6NDH3_9BACT|nr:GMC family oxidoreductase [Anaeromyxobacter paludicola]BDG10323.1 GMC family oxidoreductase [Anaeromyxobacter paludicola]
MAEPWRANGPGRVLTGADIARDYEERADACVIGSGAGGAVMAARLAEMGARVVLLEEGGLYTRNDFDMQEATAYPRLYQEKGQRATADLSITVLQGRCVGGGTTVNWTTSFRTPERVLEHWRAAHGVEGLDPATLAPHFDAVEQRLNIREWPLAQVNGNNRVLWDGCGKLGWQRALTRRNVDACANLGYCGLGCPIDAKRSMDVTYVPDAVKKGAHLYANTRAVRIELHRKRANLVRAEVLDPATDRPKGHSVLVKPKVVVLCGSAVNSPALLLRSGLDFNGRVGKRTFLHPVVASIGVYPQRIDGFYGAPQSVTSHQFIERGPGKIGFFMETAPVHPMLAASAAGGFGAAHQEVMARLGHVSALIGLTVDGFLPGDEGGTVSLRKDGRVRLDYRLRPEHWEALREANKALARVQLAAGAESVHSLHEDPVELRREADLPKLDAAPWRPVRVGLFTAHQMGGCAMGKDPDKSVVSARLKHHHVDNLFVADASIFPSSLGVNPQETVFGIAHWAAGHIGRNLR